MQQRRWAILTGEYPPDPGGVSDHTQQLARGLALAGDEVHVWAPPARGAQTPDPLVRVHRLRDRFGVSSLRSISAELARFTNETRILVQYVPHAFGWHSMNFGLCVWLAFQQGSPIDVIFHEVAYPIRANQPLRHSMLGVAHHLMALSLSNASDRIFASTTAWDELLAPTLSGGKRTRLIPSPSNLPVEVDSKVSALIRQRYAPEPQAALIGHFGTFGGHLTPLLGRILPRIMQAPSRHMLLIGRGGNAFLSDFLSRNPNCAGRIHTVLDRPAQEVAEHLAACDLVVQPYSDGLTTRRSSLMAALALGVPCVATRGHATEPGWSGSGAVAVVDPQPQAVEQAVAELLCDGARRARMSLAARQFYREHFSIESVVRTVRQVQP
ncbi:MAG: glycosyltransferase family 4 protein [Tepidisphaeraceae bacterium]